VSKIVLLHQKGCFDKMTKDEKMEIFKNRYHLEVFVGTNYFTQNLYCERGRAVCDP
jgi:hypothetical protein